VISGEYWPEEPVNVMPRQFRMPQIEHNDYAAGHIRYATPVISKFTITEMNTLGNDLALLTGCDVNVTKVADSRVRIPWKGCSNAGDGHDPGLCGGGNCNMEEMHPELIETRLTNCGTLVNLQTSAENVQYTISGAGLTVLDAETFTFSAQGCYGYAGRTTVTATQSEAAEGALIIRPGTLQVSGFSWISKASTNFTGTSPISEGLTVEGLKSDGKTWVVRKVSGVLEACETFSDPDDCPGCDGGDSVPTGGLKWWEILLIVLACLVVVGVIIFGFYSWRRHDKKRTKVTGLAKKMMGMTPTGMLKDKAAEFLRNMKKGVREEEKPTKKEHQSDDEDFGELREKDGDKAAPKTKRRGWKDI